MKDKIFIIALIFILIVFFLFRIRPINFNQKIELAVLEQIKTDFFWRTLKYIPESVSERFSFKLFEERGKAKVYCINYSHKSVFYSFYYAIDADGDVLNIKKGLTSASSNSFDLTDLMQKEAFNKIARDFNWSDTTSIHNFSFFLSNFCEKNYSSPLEDLEDYEYIIGLYTLSKDKEIILTPLLSREKVEDLLSRKEDNTYYYWYYDQGVMRFSFQLVDGEIKSVRSFFVGYLGNEIIHI